MGSSARKYVIKLPVACDACVLLLLLLVVTLFPTVPHGSSCVQDLPGPGECANATNPYATDNTTVLQSSALTCSFSDLCMYRQGCRDLDMSDWFVTDGVATVNQTSPRCGALEAFSILETPWVNFSALTCVSFTFLRLTPFDLDVFFAVRDSRVVTVVDRLQVHRHHSLNYTEEVTVYPLIGKLQFRAFGGGYGSPSYLHLYPVSVSHGPCSGQSGVVITATPPPSTNTNTTTAAAATIAPTSAVTAAATTTATAATATTTKSSGFTLFSNFVTTSGASATQSGSTLPSGSQQSITGHGSGSTISATSSVPSPSSPADPLSSRLSANCEGQKRQEEEEEENRLDFGMGVIVGMVIGVVLAVALLITGFLLHKNCFAHRQIHPHMYMSDKAPLDTSRRDSSRRDTSRRDTSRRDSSRRDTSTTDSSRRDTSTTDTSRRDTSTADSSRPVTAADLRLPL